MVLRPFFKFNVGRPAHPEMHGAEETEPHQATTQKNKREMTHGGTFMTLFGYVCRFEDRPSLI